MLCFSECCPHALEHLPLRIPHAMILRESLRKGGYCSREIEILCSMTERFYLVDSNTEILICIVC